MRAGVLKDIITIEGLKTLKNEYGEEQTDTYIKKFSTRAYVTFNNGSRIVDNNELFFSNNTTFTIRYYHNIAELDRIIWDNKKYRIISIERDIFRQSIKIICELINE